MAKTYRMLCLYRFFYRNRALYLVALLQKITWTHSTVTKSNDYGAQSTVLLSDILKSQLTPELTKPNDYTSEFREFRLILPLALVASSSTKYRSKTYSHTSAHSLVNDIKWPNKMTMQHKVCFDRYSQTSAHSLILKMTKWLNIMTMQHKVLSSKIFSNVS